MFGYNSDLEDEGIAEFVKRNWIASNLKQLRPLLNKSEKIVLDAMVERGEVSPRELTNHLDMSYGSIRAHQCNIRKVAKSLPDNDFNN